MPIRQYSVPEMTCQHCRASIETAVSRLGDIARVEVDLAALVVTVEGEASGESVRAAIAEAGYAATEIVCV